LRSSRSERDASLSRKGSGDEICGRHPKAATDPEHGSRLPLTPAFLFEQDGAHETPDGGFVGENAEAALPTKICSIGYFAFCTISGPTLAPSISPPTRSATITIAPSAQHAMKMKNPLFDGVPRVLGFGGLVCFIVAFIIK